MLTNCSICGGLLKCTPLRINPHEQPRPPYSVEPLFQLEVKCDDCGRYTTYDCIKPGTIGLPRDPDVHWYDDETCGATKYDEVKFDQSKYDAAMDKLYAQKRERRRRFGLLNLSDDATDALFAGENTCEDTDNVIEFTGITRHDVPPERIVKHLGRLDIQEIVAVGFLEDGSEFFASSKSDGAAALWHLMRAQHKLMTYAEGE